ncbi:MAG TPA: hypothetical protein VKF81_15505 [Blastocatellia bacterium]|nr:hypothetical protein [Blastocatellia bacterium]
MTKARKGRLSRYVRSVMRQKHLKLRHIEERSGGEITDGYAADILSGRSDNPSAAKIKALARALDVDAHAVFDAASGPLPQRVAGRSNDISDITVFLSMMQEVSESPEMVRIVEEFLRLEPQDRIVVLRYVESLNESKRKRGRQQRGKR